MTVSHAPANKTAEGVVTADKAPPEYFGGLARLVKCAGHADERGRLLPFDFGMLPFMPGRAFVVSNVPAGTVRGGHAHKYGEQMLVCAQGRIGVLMRYQGKQISLVLEPGRLGLMFGPDVWCQQTYLEEGSVLLAFASEPYSAESYVTAWT